MNIECELPLVLNEDPVSSKFFILWANNIVVVVNVS